MDSSQHQLCKGFKVKDKEGEEDKRCGSRAKYQGYCGAAHHPEYNHYKVWEFRAEEPSITRNDLLKLYNSTDPYTGEYLHLWKTHRDHIMECQIPTHVFNLLYKYYNDRGYDESQIDNTLPTVKKFTNRTNNLVPVHKDINKLKGAAIKAFLDEKTLGSEDAPWTYHLLEANMEINWNDIKKMEKQRLDRRTTASITRRVVEQLKEVEYKLNDEDDNGTTRRLIKRFHSLRVQISNT